MRLNNVKITSTHLECFLDKSKNDQNQDGRTIFISRFDTEFCSLNLLEKFFVQGVIKVDCHEKLS